MSVASRARVHAALGDETRLRAVDELWLGDRTPAELGGMLGIDSNLLSHHLDVLEDAGAVSRHVSAGDGRRRYVRVNADVVGDFLPGRRLNAGSVLFVCTHNSARSQFAEAVLRSSTGVGVESAGLHPASVVHPKAIRVAMEHGLDLSRAVPRSYEEVETTPDLVVSVCDRACEAPLPFMAERLHWSIPDPVETGRLDGFRRAFDDISRRVELLAAAIEQEDP